MIPSKRAHLHVVGLSHPGQTGKNNEDRFAVTSYYVSRRNATPALFAVVADGIGGHRAGEVAAEMVVDYISHAIAESDAYQPVKIMEQAVQGASHVIAMQAATGTNQQGMGATCACTWVVGDRLYTASVGDSRIYLIREKNIQQLTVDHTWIREALDSGDLTPDQAHDHPNAHMIQRYLGSTEPPEVDFRLRLHDGEMDVQSVSNQGLRLEPGDILLLCSDGLTDMVWYGEIIRVFGSAGNLHSAAQALIDLANERGGHDNITVVLLAVPQPEETYLIEKQRNIMPWLMRGIMAGVILIAVLIALGWYLMRTGVEVIP